MQPQPMQTMPQQVVVTNAPVVVQQQGMQPQQQLYIKVVPIPFWVAVAFAVIMFISNIASAEDAGGYVGAFIYAIIIGIEAATIYNLEIRSTPQGLYVGFGPLQVCFCCADMCLQRVTIPYSNIASFEQTPNNNRCWFPITYLPGVYTKGDDCNNCCMNYFCRWCCCTNTWFLNGACSICCFVISLRDLVVLQLRTPISCCCYTSYKVAISVDNAAQVGNFLRSMGIRSDVELVTSTTTTVVQTTQQVPMQTQVPMQQTMQPQPMMMNNQQPMMMQQQNPNMMQQQQFQQQNMGMNEGQGNYPNITQPQPN